MCVSLTEIVEGSETGFFLTQFRDAMAAERRQSAGRLVTANLAHKRGSLTDCPQWKDATHGRM